MLKRAFQVINGGAAEKAVSSQSTWMEAIQGVRGAYADSTLDAHLQDFSAFADWCEGQGLAPTPANPTHVARFVEVMSDRCAIRTLQRRLHVIRRVHQWLKLPDPTTAQAVQLAMRRAVKLCAKPPRQALGLNAALRDRLLSACPDTLLGLRDKAMIAVGYDTLCRRSELVALRRQDVVPLRGGTAKVLIARAKNDPASEGRYAYLSAEAYEVLRAWISASKIKSGPIFRTITVGRVGETAMHPRIVNRTLQAAASRAGCAPDVVARLSAHSLRVGAAQDLAIAGRSVLQIMRAGRWYSLSGMMGYVRKADVNIWCGLGPNGIAHDTLDAL